MKDWGLLKKTGVVLLGLFIIGVGINMVIDADLGCDPLTTFLIGGHLLSGLSIGRISQLMGLSLLLINFMIDRRKPGFGTALNMIFVGIFVDAVRWSGILPPARIWVMQAGYLLLGILLLGGGSALYVAAGLGEGPFEGFMLSLAKKLRKSIRFTRVGIDSVILAVGYLAGGPIGIGTAVAAVGVGVVINAALWLIDGRRMGGSDHGLSGDGILFREWE